jgi:hypothetical protein
MRINSKIAQKTENSGYAGKTEISVMPADREFGYASRQRIPVLSA